MPSYEKLLCRQRNTDCSVLLPRTLECSLVSACTQAEREQLETNEKVTEHFVEIRNLVEKVLPDGDSKIDCTDIMKKVIPIKKVIEFITAIKKGDLPLIKLLHDPYFVKISIIMQTGDPTPEEKQMKQIRE